MRIKALLLGDIRFQFKYGFYFIYLIFATIYISLLYALPVAWRERAAILMIFTDPAAMGLYFMGAIILFEKSERVLNSIAISPVKPMEYVVSKLFSIALISTAVGLLIGFGGGVISNPFFFVLGVFLGSCLFSSVGLMVAANIASLNQFVVATIPAELVINLPAIAWLFGWKQGWLMLHPGVCIIELCQNGGSAFPAAVILVFWTTLSAILALHVIEKSLRSLGGAKL
ncbi:MAG: ABC transporter permease [Clostridiaceae bacterium]|nr:ABC transporter permease [Clostridiaceae bacterium]